LPRPPREKCRNSRGRPKGRPYERWPISRQDGLSHARYLRHHPNGFYTKLAGPAVADPCEVHTCWAPDEGSPSFKIPVPPAKSSKNRLDSWKLAPTIDAESSRRDFHGQEKDRRVAGGQISRWADGQIGRWADGQVASGCADKFFWPATRP